MGTDKPTISNRIAEASTEIILNPISEIVYQHGIFCQVGLPRTKVKDKRVFERDFKNASLRIEAGALWDGKQWVDQPIPSGPKPRLALIYINSEAVRTKSSAIDIGDSCADFLRRIGLRDQDGRTYGLFKRQMNALAAATFNLGFSLQTNQATSVYTKPIEEFTAWVAKDDKQASLWPGSLRLSQKYFDSLSKHAVPLDPRALRALAHSALALDIYSFLAHRLCTLNRPFIAPWTELKKQFGKEYTGQYGLINFKAEFLKMLKPVLAVYPKAEGKVTPVTGGLDLSPSDPPVSKPRFPH